MNTLVLDDCLQNLMLAEESMKKWIPMTDYEMIVEAVTDPAKAEAVQNNENVQGKTTGHLRKAIDAVIGMIKKLGEALSDFIARFTLKGEERRQFEAFKQQMADDPSLRNKKVTVNDFRKIKADYDNILNEVEREIRAVKADEKHPIDQIVDRVKTFLGGAVKSTGVIVTSDIAIKLAESNVETARVINQALKLDEDFMKELSNTLGESDAAKYQKRVNAAAKNTLLTRLKIKLLRREYESASDCVNATMTSLKHGGFANPFTDMGRKFLKNDYTGTAIKTTGKEAVKAVGSVAKGEARRKVDKAVSKVLDPKNKRGSGEGEYKSAREFFTGKKKK